MTEDTKNEKPKRSQWPRVAMFTLALGASVALIMTNHTNYAWLPFVFAIFL